MSSSLKFIEVFVPDFEELNFRERSIDEGFLTDYNNYEDYIEDSNGEALIDSFGDEVS